MMTTAEKIALILRIGNSWQPMDHFAKLRIETYPHKETSEFSSGEPCFDAEMTGSEVSGYRKMQSVAKTLDGAIDGLLLLVQDELARRLARKREDAARQADECGRLEAAIVDVRACLLWSE